MVSRLLDLCLDVLFITFLLPSLAWYLVQTSICSSRNGFGPAMLLKTGVFRKSVGEFNFEHAIEAYEELIDSTFAGGRP